MVKSIKHIYLTFPKLHVSLKAAKKEKRRKGKKSTQTNANKKMAASFSKDEQEVDVQS